MNAVQLKRASELHKEISTIDGMLEMLRSERAEGELFRIHASKSYPPRGLISVCLDPSDERRCFDFVADAESLAEFTALIERRRARLIAEAESL